jgi:ABC-type ATPase involved in cell division/GNAT superfamily N-acetyltransferase
MPRVDCLRSVEIERTPRVTQLEGLFDIPPAQRSERRWQVELPLEQRDWRIGLIVGPSGSGKSTLARELFGESVVTGYDWPAQKSLVDGFPREMGIREITALLSSVGFSSPPSWLRPFAALSTGEQFRATLARALAERPRLAVIDEFTSVVDRTVAQIGSAALARTVRGTGRRLVAVGCHYDVIDWLQPDWMFDPAAQTFEWRCLQPRPRLRLDVVRVSAAAWPRFGAHHYLSAGLNRVARCFVALCQGRPAAFTAVLSQPGPGGGRWREHRTVCLPDFQGVGIGHALSELVAAMFRATGKRYCSVTSHPGMIAHRRRSPLWRMYRAPSLGHRTEGKHAKFNRTAALTRLTAAFEYTGPADRLSAQTLGVIE